ncbi:MAG: sensor histidine kinase [Bacteroidia bacterium]
MNKLIFTCLFLFLINSALAQSKSAEDTAFTRIEGNITNLQQYRNTDTTTYKNQLYTLTKTIARLTNNTSKAKAYLLVARYGLINNNYAEITSYTAQVLKIASVTHDAKLITKAYYFLGSAYLNKERYTTSISYFIQSLKMADKTNDTTMKAHINSAFGTVYERLNKMDSARVYYEKSLRYFTQKKDSAFIQTGLVNLGSVLITQNKYTQGFTYLHQGLAIAKHRGDVITEATILYNIANAYERKGNLDSALMYAQRSLSICKQNNFVKEQLFGQTLLAAIELKQKKYNAAINYCKSALPLAIQLSNTPIIITLYQMLVDGYKNTNEYENAFKYSSLLTQLKDSVYTIENNNYIEELKQKYNLDQKNTELQLTKKIVTQEKQSNTQKTIIIIALLVAAVSGIFVVRATQKKNKINNELALEKAENEKQNSYFEAFINGQEKEKTRIAADLHDGLAQNLVLLKLGISSLKIDNTEQQNQLNNCANDIDTMINETRKIAHDMMPDVLIDLGLQKAIRSLVTAINNSHTTLSINFTVATPYIKADNTYEIQLYRITQELINNIIKHANATQCHIHLDASQTYITLQVKDNGKGLDTFAQSNGIGLKNIYTRVNSIKGTTTIDSEAKKGTTFTITITIPITITALV